MSEVPVSDLSAFSSTIVSLSLADTVGLTRVAVIGGVVVMVEVVARVTEVVGLVSSQSLQWSLLWKQMLGIFC